MTFSVADRLLSRLQRRSIEYTVTKPRQVSTFVHRSFRGGKRERLEVRWVGCHSIEHNDDRSWLWTSGQSEIVCFIPPTMKTCWVSLDLYGGPIPKTVFVKANDASTVGYSLKRRRTITFRAPCNGELRLTLQTAMFVPSQTGLSKEDHRLLGVRIFELRIAKYWWRVLRRRRRGQSS